MPSIEAAVCMSGALASTTVFFNPYASCRNSVLDRKCLFSVLLIHQGSKLFASLFFCHF